MSHTNLIPLLAVLQISFLQAQRIPLPPGLHSTLHSAAEPQKLTLVAALEWTVLQDLPAHGNATQFKQLDTLPILCLYILSLMIFVINNPDKFPTDLSVHYLKSRHKNHLHRPTTCYSSISKRVMYSATKVFNSLTPHILKLLNKKQQFKYSLKEYLITNTFYSLEEFFSESHN